MVVDLAIIVLVHLFDHLTSQLNGRAPWHDLHKVLRADEAIAILVQLLKTLTDLEDGLKP